MKFLVSVMAVLMLSGCVATTKIKEVKVLMDANGKVTGYEHHEYIQQSEGELPQIQYQWLKTN